VHARAIAAGMPPHRATDITLAVHELAANAVIHGPGTGHLHMHATAGQLTCQITQAGPASHAHPPDGTQPESQPWPVQRGHGLWLIRQLADHVTITATPAGPQAVIAFTLTPAPDTHGQLSAL
jgi:anti-sigma regulatory factor (Ser/Thr protein kinase)